MRRPSGPGGCSSPSRARCRRCRWPRSFPRSRSRPQTRRIPSRGSSRHRWSPGASASRGHHPLENSGRPVAEQMRTIDQHDRGAAPAQDWIASAHCCIRDAIASEHGFGGESGSMRMSSARVRLCLWERGKTLSRVRSSGCTFYAVSRLGRMKKIFLVRAGAGKGFGGPRICFAPGLDIPLCQYRQYSSEPLPENRGKHFHEPYSLPR